MWFCLPPDLLLRSKELFKWYFSLLLVIIHLLAHFSSSFINIHNLVCFLFRCCTPSGANTERKSRHRCSEKEIKLLKHPKHNSQSSKLSFYLSTKTGLKVQKLFWKQLSNRNTIGLIMVVWHETRSYLSFWKNPFWNLCL